MDILIFNFKKMEEANIKKLKELENIKNKQF